MQDYSISKFTRKCSVSGRKLAPGESYFSVIVPEGDFIKRMDIAAQEWKGPSEESIGWWKNQMPQAGEIKLKPAPNGVLLDILSELVETSGKEPLAYLLALLLVRRRVLSEEDLLDADDQSLDETPTHWALICQSDGRQWNVPLASPSPEAMADLQQELNELLFTEE